MGIIAVVGRDYNDGPLILSGCLALMSKAEIVVKRLLSGSRPSWTHNHTVWFTLSQTWFQEIQKISWNLSSPVIRSDNSLTAICAFQNFLLEPKFFILCVMEHGFCHKKTVTVLVRHAKGLS